MPRLIDSSTEGQCIISDKETVHVVHEYDTRGWHRLVVKGALGNWANYGDIAYFTYGSVKIAATTEYYWPNLPEIFRVVPVRNRETPPPTENGDCYYAHNEDEENTGLSEA